MMVLMMLLTQGSGSDLLDYLHTQTYWKLQGAEMSVASMRAQLAPVREGDLAGLVGDFTGDDAGKQQAARGKIQSLGAAALPALYKAVETVRGKADKAAALQQLIGEVLEKPKIGAVRRLMAIRTLGELKNREALDTLRGLLTSKVMFEADYARAAIAAIEGKAYKRAPLAAKTLAKDPWMLPAGCGIVGQMVVRQGGGIDFDQAIKAMGPMLGGQDPQQALEQITRMLLDATGRVGNIRIHSVTLGVASDVGSNSGFGVVLARGLYDAGAVKQVLSQQGAGKTRKVDDVEILCPADEASLILPSNELLVVVFGPGPRRHSRVSANGATPPETSQADAPTAPAVAAMAAAIKNGTGSLRADGDIGKLIKTVDTTAPLWAAIKVSDAYRQGGPIIQPFDTATLTGKPTEDGKALDLKLVARGTNADGVTAAVQKLEEGLQEARQEISQDAGRMPFLKSIADFLNSVHVNRDGKTVTVTARVEGVSSMMMLFMTGMRSAPAARAAPARVEAEAAP